MCSPYLSPQCLQFLKFLRYFLKYFQISWKIVQIFSIPSIVGTVYQTISLRFRGIFVWSRILKIFNRMWENVGNGSFLLETETIPKNIRNSLENLHRNPNHLNNLACRGRYYSIINSFYRINYNITEYYPKYYSIFRLISSFEWF